MHNTFKTADQHISSDNDRRLNFVHSKLVPESIEPDQTSEVNEVVKVEYMRLIHENLALSATVSEEIMFARIEKDEKLHVYLKESALDEVPDEVFSDSITSITELLSATGKEIVVADDYIRIKHRKAAEPLLEKVQLLANKAKM